MIILAFLMSAGLAAPADEDLNCQSHLLVGEDRGVEFYDRVAGAAKMWFEENPDPRRPRVLNANVIEVSHGVDGAGVAIVEIQTAYARNRIPILVRVQHDRIQMTAFDVVDQGLREFCRRTSNRSQVAANAAMAQLLTSAGSLVEGLNARILSRVGHSDQFFEVLVSAKIAGKPFEKIYAVFSSEGEAVRVEESGTHRYTKSVLKRNFEQLLLKGRGDPTLKISSISRQTLNSWRVVYTLGEVNRVNEAVESTPRKPGRRLEQVTIGPVGPQLGRAVLTGPGLETKSHLLKVDDDHRFFLADEPMR